MGDISIELFASETPVAVENFVGLARGTKEYTTPNPRGTLEGPFYDECLFWQVAPGYLIQTGDPTGMGASGAGYDFDDEYPPDHRFDRGYLVGTAGRGAKSNGSQFFITQQAMDHLTGNHTLFGEVLDAESRAVVDAIGAVSIFKCYPVDPVAIQTITIEE